MAETSQVFHDKAIEAGKELRKLFISLSTGILAVVFFSLTRKIEPPLTTAEKTVLISIIIVLSITILNGLIAWFIDSKRYYFFAKAKEYKEKNDDLNKTKYRNKIKTLDVIRIVTDFLIILPFFLGIVLSSIFIIIRVMN